MGPYTRPHSNANCVGLVTSVLDVFSIYACGRSSLSPCYLFECNLVLILVFGWGTRIRTLDNGARTHRIATILSPSCEGWNLSAFTGKSRGNCIAHSSWLIGSNKFETRSTKFETNPKSEIQIFKTSETVYGLYKGRTLKYENYLSF
jgi:hypothetical protein